MLRKKLEEFDLETEPTLSAAPLKKIKLDKKTPKIDANQKTISSFFKKLAEGNVTIPVNA